MSFQSLPHFVSETPNSSSLAFSLSPFPRATAYNWNSKEVFSGSAPILSWAISRVPLGRELISGVSSSSLREEKWNGAAVIWKCATSSSAREFFSPILPARVILSFKQRISKRVCAKFYVLSYPRLWWKHNNDTLWISHNVEWVMQKQVIVYPTR